MKTKLNDLSVVTSALAYLYLIFMTAKGTGEGLSLSTFGLWSALAWITSFTMFKQGVNPAVPMIYGLGASATTIILLIKGRYGWSVFDTFIAISVACCIWLLLTSGPRWALILSIIAGILTALPFILVTWSNPQGSPIIPNAGFLIANTLSFVAAKAWTIEDRLFSGVNVVLCSILVLPWLLI